MKVDEAPSFEKYVKLYRRLLLLNEENELGATVKTIQELLSFSAKIFSSSSISEAFLYFCLKGAATAWTLQHDLKMPEATVYRALKRLRSLNIVIPAIKVSKIRNSKGGPRPTVWALRNASTDEISKTLRLHFRLLSPKYRVAEEVAQTILDEHILKRQVQELSYREIVIFIREHNVPFRTPDIADLAASYLQDKGIKIWR